MRPIIYLVTLLLVISAFTPSACAEKTDENVTYIIPIKGPIERGLLYVVRRGLAQAEKEGASAIIFHMDTPGGLISVTEEIIRMLIDLPENVKTYTFVDKDALSAGALISLATDEIYMAPGSRIGASAVISILGDLPEGDIKEKVVSSTLALVTSAAGRKGHNPKIAEAMMRKEYEFKIGDQIICESGKLLTLTETQAEQLVGENKKDRHPLLSSGIVKNIDELMKKIGRTETSKVVLEVTWSEKLARWIELFSILFLTAGILGIYIEIKTPGFGLPGILGIICLAVFFWGHNVAGLAGMEEIIVFLLGVILLLVEIFIIPGFGFVGISGIVLILVSIAMAMVEHYPGMPFYQVHGSQINQAVVNLGAALIGSFILMIILARYLPETKMFYRVALASELRTTDGYQTSLNTGNLIGMKGIADTALHPAGIGAFGEKRLNVVSRGDFIGKGTPILIAETHGSRIVVESEKKKET